MATSSGLFLATIYNQSQLAERKHVARYWSINTAATAVPLSAHPSPLVITTKLSAAILGGPLFGGGVLPPQYCPCGLFVCYYLLLKSYPKYTRDRNRADSADKNRKKQPKSTQGTCSLTHCLRDTYTKDNVVYIITC